MSDTIHTDADPADPSPRPPQRRLRRWAIRLGYAVAVLVVCLLVGMWGWGKYEDRSLVRRIEALRQAGEPVDPADLASPPVPDAANAAAAFRKAARMIDESSKAWVALEEQFDPPRPPLTDRERAILRAAVAENAGALRRAEAPAELGGADWGIVLASPMIHALVPDLSEQRKLAQLLNADALLAIDVRDVRRALRRARQVLAISRALDRHPTLVAHLVAAGISALAAQMAVHAAPDLTQARGAALSTDVREEARRLTAALLDERAFDEGLLLAYRSERVMQLDAITAVVEGRMAAPGQQPGNPAIRGGVVRTFFVRNASAALDHTGAMLDAAAATDDWPAFRDRIAASPSAVERSPRFYFLAHILTAANDRATYQHYRVAAERRMAAVVLAVALYRADHDGRLPTTLSALVPEYLAAVPADPLAGGGKPLRYAPAPGRPRVYSVGEDGIDHGGRAVDPDKPRRPQEGVTDNAFDIERQPRIGATDGDGQGDPTQTRDAAPDAGQDTDALTPDGSADRTDPANDGEESQ